MKIALINENSQAAKNALIEETLKKVVEPLGHEVFNYGMYSAEDEAQLTYVQIGILGQVHPTVCKNFDMDKNCFVAEIDVLPLFENVDENIKYKALPKFPAAERDIAVLVDKTALVGDLEATIAKASGALLENIKLFDVYEGDRIPEDKKSVAFAISFRAADRSLTSEEVNKVFNKIVKDLQFKNNAQLR